jgi:hypothetical protein
MTPLPVAVTVALELSTTTGAGGPNRPLPPELGLLPEALGEVAVAAAAGAASHPTRMAVAYA